MKLSPVLFVAAMLSLAPLGSPGGLGAMTAAAQEPSHNAATAAAQPPAHDHAAMLAAEKAKADADLDVKLAKMEKAKGNEKVALMADILKQLVAEHKANASAAGHQHGSTATSGAGGPEGHAGHDMASCPMCASMHGAGDSAMKHEGAGAMACPMMAQH